MTTTARQNAEFTKAVITLPHYPLDDAIQWMQDNLEPDDVFSDMALANWATSNLIDQKKLSAGEPGEANGTMPEAVGG